MQILIVQNCLTETIAIQTDISVLDKTIDSFLMQENNKLFVWILT